MPKTQAFIRLIVVNPETNENQYVYSRFESDEESWEKEVEAHRKAILLAVAKRPELLPVITL